MNVQKILFPTDFSVVAEHAFQYAVAMAHDSKGELIILHVVEPGSMYSSSDKYFYTEDNPNNEQIGRQLEAIVPHATVRFRHVLVVGSPAEKILELADSEHADLIVLGTHGWTGLQHLLMGSVAETIVRRAPCPVMTVKAYQTTAARAGGVNSGQAAS